MCVYETGDFKELTFPRQMNPQDQPHLVLKALLTSSGKTPAVLSVGDFTYSAD